MLGYVKLVKLHNDVNDVQDSLRLPSNPERSIAAECEGIAQSFAFMARLFEEQARRPTDKKEP